MEKIVTSKLGMNLPLITLGSGLLYEVGDDLEESEVANYAANLDKVRISLFFSFLILHTLIVIYTIVIYSSVGVI